MSSGNYPVIIIKGEDELFFCEVFPETDGEVLAVQFRIDTFFDGDGFKVGSPELLKKLFIFCHQLLIQFAGQKMGSFGFETDFIDFLPIVIITVFPFDIKREYGYYYNRQKVDEVRFETKGTHLLTGKLDQQLMAEDEQLFQQLWRTYFKTIAIKERINPKLHRQNLPVRFWKYLTEK